MFNAFASDLIVAAEGETEAFSILDSIPAEIPVAAPSSEPVSPSDLRNLRTSLPIRRVTVDGSVGAIEPLREVFSLYNPTAEPHCERGLLEF